MHQQQEPPPKVSGSMHNPKIYGLSRNQRAVFIKTLMRFGAQRDASGAFAWPSGLEHLTPKTVEAMHAYRRKVCRVHMSKAVDRWYYHWSILPLVPCVDPHVV